MLSASLSGFAEVTVLKGVYQEQDLYVKNPFSDDGVGFCVFEVIVNGDVTTDEVNSSAFAIDLSILGLRKGDPIEVVIRSKEGCAPTVINPDAIAPPSTFELVDFSLEQGQLKWSTTGETGSLPFIVEQYKWNKWVEVGALDGAGQPEAQEYAVAVPVHNGTNIFRIKQIDSSGIHFSENMEFDNVSTAEVSLMEDKVFEEIRFTMVTPFELYDEYGELIAEDESDHLDVKDLPSGRYYLNYADQFGKVIIKK